MGCNSQQSQQLHWHLTTTCEIRQGLLGLFHYLLTGQSKLKALSFGGKPLWNLALYLHQGWLNLSRSRIDVGKLSSRHFQKLQCYTLRNNTKTNKKSWESQGASPLSPSLSLNDPLIRPSISCGETWHWGGNGRLGICMRCKPSTRHSKNCFWKMFRSRSYKVMWRLWNKSRRISEMPGWCHDEMEPSPASLKMKECPPKKGTILGGKDRHGLFQTLWDWEIFIFRDWNARYVW